MKLSHATLALVTALAFSQANAQETPTTETESPAQTEATTTAPAEESSNPDNPLSLGQPVESDIGQPYVRSTHGSWEIRCIKTGDGIEPCQMYQRLVTEDDSPIAEMTVFPLFQNQGDAVAGGSISAPLETLLTGGARLQIDNGEGRIYPFRYCTQIGCYASIGFTAEEVGRLKAGNVARVTVVPLVAPDQKITIEVSLTGFTAGYNELTKIIQEMAAAARAAAEAAQQNQDQPAQDGN